MLVYVIAHCFYFLGHPMCTHWAMLATANLNICRPEISSVVTYAIKCTSMKMQKMRETELKWPLWVTEGLRHLKDGVVLLERVKGFTLRKCIRVGYQLRFASAAVSNAVF